MYAHVGAARRRLENKLAGRRHLLLLTAATEIQWKCLTRKRLGEYWLGSSTAMLWRKAAGIRIETNLQGRRSKDTFNLTINLLRLEN
jgi:hypothetical protein